jgi:hypothetical protein
MFLGEDSEWLLVNGNVPADEVTDVVIAACRVEPFEDMDWTTVTRWTYAALHDMCPHHLAWSDDCGSCSILRENGAPIVTLTALGDADDAEKRSPGWFPVTVVSLGG